MIKRLRGYQVESRHSVLVDHSQSSLVEGDDDEGLKADSHELGLMHAAVADSSISTEIGFFLFFRTTHFCRSRMHQTQLV